MKIGEVLRVGALAAVVAACGSPERTPTPSSLETEKPVTLYNHRIALSKKGNVIVCYTDEFPFRDDMPWAFFASVAYCPDGEANRKFFESADTLVSPLKLKFKSTDAFQYVDQKSLREKGEEIPPVSFK